MFFEILLFTKVIDNKKWRIGYNITIFVSI